MAGLRAPLTLACACVALACGRTRPPDLTKALPPGTWFAAHVDLAAAREGDVPAWIARAIGECGLEAKTAAHLDVAVSATHAYIQTRASVPPQQIRCALAALDVMPAGAPMTYDTIGDRLVATLDIDAGPRTPLDPQAIAEFLGDRAAPVSLAVRVDPLAGTTAPAWSATLSGRDLALALGSEQLAFETYGGTQLAIDEPSTMSILLDGPTVRYHADGGLFGEDAATAVRRRVMDTLIVPGPAMEPTLVVGDVVAFAKHRLAGEPTRGDVIVFTRDKHDFVRRVLGVAGDRVRIERGAYSLDGKPVPTRLVAAAHTLLEVDPDGGPPRSFERQRWTETVGGMSYEITRLDDTRSDDREVEVPEGKLYVVGDARADSSRELIPAAAVRGRAILVAWSRAPDGVRWNRIGRWLGRP